MKLNGIQSTPNSNTASYIPVKDISLQRTMVVNKNNLAKVELYQCYKSKSMAMSSAMS